MENQYPSDIVTLPASNLEGTSQVTCHIASELMKNHQPPSILEPNSNIAVVQDSQGKPMIFSIGTDDVFRLLKYDESSATGFSAIELSSGFIEHTTARTFAVSQDKKGSITVAVALSKAGEAATTIYIASMLSDDYTQTDWHSFGALTKAVTGVDKAFGAEKMLIGTSDDGQAPLLIVSGHINGPKYYYQIDAAAASAVKCEFPQNVNQDPNSLQDMSIGYAFGQRAIYFLYKIGNSQTLECSTIANSKLGKMHYDYSPGNQKIDPSFRNLHYNCLSTPTGAQTNPLLLSSDLYVGTNTGIYVFKDAKIRSMQKVTDKLQDVHEIIVKEDRDNISIWAMCSPNKLYYIYGKKGSTYSWNEPVLFSGSAIHIAPIRSHLKLANELFLVNQDQSLTHYWQDPQSTLWQQRVMNFAHAGKTLEFNSFTTHIHLDNDQGAPLQGCKLRITSSEWMYVQMNGLTYSLDQHNAAEVETDLMGNVTIVQMTSDISSAIYHVEADFLDKTLNIYPNGRIHKGLQVIKSGGDLKKAVTADGKPVVTAQLDDKTLDGVASSIAQISDAGASFMAGAGTSANTFVSVTDQAVKHTGLLNVSHLPTGFVTGMKVQNGLLQPYVPLVQPKLLGDIFDDIGSVAGDVFHTLEHVFETAIQYIRDGVTYLQDGISFVLEKVGDGLTFVLTLADKVMKIALKTLGCVFKALNWVLKLVGIDLNKVLEWLGRLLGWTDILETSDRLIDMFNGVCDSLVEAIPAMRANITGTLEAIEHQIAEPSIVDKFKQSNIEKPSIIGTGIAALFQNPMTNWPMYHILHGNFFSGSGSSGGDDSGIAQQIQQTLGKFVDQGLFTAETALQLMIETFIEEIPKLAIGDILSKLLQIIAVASIETVKHTVEAVFSLGKILVQAIKEMLNEEVEVPILSSLLELIIGDRKLTLLRVFTLIAAIPTRIIYRIATGDSLANDKIGILQKDDLRNLITGQTSGLPKQLKLGETQQMTAAAVQNEALIRAEKEENKQKEEDGYKETVDVMNYFYIVLRSIEVVCANISLAEYTYTPNDGGARLPIARPILNFAQKTEIAWSALALGCVAYNIYETNTSVSMEISAYQIVILTFSSIKILLSGIGRYKPEYKIFARVFSMISYSVALVLPWIIASPNTDKNRSNNMRIASNVFLNLYKVIANVPAKIKTLPALFALVAINTTFGLTHVSLVAARIPTDKEDHVTFSIV
ncbi:hypothetical protein DFQ01_108200 [Paenibacillus cellulosilyticus]|uniref:Uncharacterized protein n=1 Tax=Paenibacillus cellulosilyticus TaxID=375489 RepID=A0A2V2Z2P1_9BACL|nr:hypothetical protein [Paenibacillus cellulosilyticus]PWW02921.1 hypothetical protein DFQ01_108200 [Paenibacillus cellulosilyticus]QKS45829.1 hypothetical protein HUB94_16315 [Paenibacillus cellulosilyticus]